MKISNRPARDQRAFTLVELMISMVVAFIVTAAIYASYKVQQQTATSQQQVTEMQQNLRAGMETMMRTFRMAGYDPDGTGVYLINTANANRFAFDADTCEDGSDPPADCASETEIYDFTLSDTDLDGIGDTLSSNGQVIAENIERIEFRYLLANGNFTLAPPTTQFDQIRSVQITLVARSAQPDYKYTDTATLSSRSGTSWTPPAKFVNHRRRILYSTIELRNMGL